MEQSQVLVARVCMNAGIELRHLSALALQHLEKHILPLTKNARYVVLRVPGVGLAKDRLGQLARLGADRFAHVDQADILSVKDNQCGLEARAALDAARPDSSQSAPDCRAGPTFAAATP